MVINGGSSSPQVLAKRDHEGDVNMSDVSSENVSRCCLSLTLGPARGLTSGLDRKEHVTCNVRGLSCHYFRLDQDGKCMQGTQG